MKGKLICDRICFQWITGKNLNNFGVMLSFKPFRPSGSAKAKAYPTKMDAFRMLESGIRPPSFTLDGARIPAAAKQPPCANCRTTTSRSHNSDSQDWLPRLDVAT